MSTKRDHNQAAQDAATRMNGIHLMVLRLSNMLAATVARAKEIEESRSTGVNEINQLGDLVSMAHEFTEEKLKPALEAAESDVYSLLSELQRTAAGDRHQHIPREAREILEAAIDFIGNESKAGRQWMLDQAIDHAIKSAPEGTLPYKRELMANILLELPVSYLLEVELERASPSKAAASQGGCSS